MSIKVPTKTISLSDFTKGSPGLPPRIVIHGRAGVGKTGTAAAAPNPIFLLSPGETGLQTLMDSNLVDPSIYSRECEDLADVMAVVEFLREAKHSRETLVIDTINGVEKLANLQVCRTDYENDMTNKFMNFQVGYRTVATGVWKQLLVALDRLRTERRMQIVLLAHTGVATHKNPQGDDYMRWVPSFDGKPTWEITSAWADMVLLADYETEAKKLPDAGKNAKAKGTGGETRLFRCTWNAAYDAKNRSGLGDKPILMGSSGKEAWQNLQDAIANAKIITTTTTTTTEESE